MPAPAARHGVRILGGDAPADDLDFDLDDSLASFGEPDDGRCREVLEVVEEVDQPSSPTTSGRRRRRRRHRRLWPPKSGLSHRFPRAEEDEFWRDQPGVAQGWRARASGRARADLQPEWTRPPDRSGPSRPTGAAGPRSPSPTSSPTGPTHRRRRRASTASSSRTDAAATGEGSGPSRCRTGPSRRRARSRASSPSDERRRRRGCRRRRVGVGQWARCRASASGDSDWAEADFADARAAEGRLDAVGALRSADVVVDDDAEFEEDVAARRRGFRAEPSPEGPERCDRRAAGRSAPARGAARPPAAQAPARARRRDARPACQRLRLRRRRPRPADPRPHRRGHRGGRARLLQARPGPGRVPGRDRRRPRRLRALRSASAGRATTRPRSWASLGAMAMVGIAYKADNYGLQAFPLFIALIVDRSRCSGSCPRSCQARPVIDVAITLLVFAYVGVLGGVRAACSSSSPNGVGLVLGVGALRGRVTTCSATSSARSSAARRLAPPRVAQQDRSRARSAACSRR